MLALIGINTLLTLLIMMLMICSSMPSTSNYVPLMGKYQVVFYNDHTHFIGWYYMGIICAIVFGTLLATLVLFIHGQKTHLKPIPAWLRKIINNKIVSIIILEPPQALTDIWTEYGFVNETRVPPGEIEEAVMQEINKNVRTFLVKKD